MSMLQDDLSVGPVRVCARGVHLQRIRLRRGAGLYQRSGREPGRQMRPLHRGLQKGAI
jgi:hypothetical protein